MNKLPQIIDDDERAELCAAFDLKAEMELRGYVVKQKGNHFVTAIREERTASCCVYPPFVGKLGEKGWTYCDYGADGRPGDALGFLVDVEQMPFLEAVEYMAGRSGYIPRGVADSKKRRAGEKITPSQSTQSHRKTQRKVRTAGKTSPPVIAKEEQSELVSRFLDKLQEIDPTSRDRGFFYVRNRGCLIPRHQFIPFFLRAVNAERAGELWKTPGNQFVEMAYALSAEASKQVAAALLAENDGERFEAAGLVSRKSGRCLWRNETVLFVCRDLDLSPLYLVGRPTETKKGPKYISQSCQGGAIRYPFGLPSLILPSQGWPLEDNARPGELVITEGAMDALASMSFGLPALAMLSRPSAGGVKDDYSAAHRMLSPHIELLQEKKQILVLPDNDAGEKGQLGRKKAGELVGWLKARGCAAKIAKMEEVSEACKPDSNDLCENRERMLEELIDSIRWRKAEQQQAE
jgi:hypothetical protein